MKKANLLIILNLLCVTPSYGQPLQDERVSPPRVALGPSCGTFGRASPKNRHSPSPLHTTISAAQRSKSLLCRNLGIEMTNPDSNRASHSQVRRSFCRRPAHLR